MSFWPLPTTLVDALRAAAERGPVVELGSGDGSFAQRLAELGVAPVLLDRIVPGRAPRHPFICGDVRELPLAKESVSGFVLANVTRHLSRDDRIALGSHLHGIGRPGAKLFVIEDDPQAATRAAKTYRMTLDLLANVDVTRGRAESDSNIAPILEAAWGAPKLRGRGHNKEQVLDPMLPLRWAAARTLERNVRAQLDGLAEKVELWGMEYGEFWYLVFEKETT